MQIFWGPLAFCVALMITTQHPLRYPLQALVSLGQIYGDVLYYATSMFDHYVNGLTYFRPEAYYFWVYYFFMNFIWIVIPGSEWRTVFAYLTQCAFWITKANEDGTVLLVKSIRASAMAFAALEKQSKAQQANGNLKKVV